MSHTPGPAAMTERWATHYRKRGGGGEAVDILTVNGAYVLGRGVVGPFNSEHRADHRLAAAAPRLLDALERLYAGVQSAWTDEDLHEAAAAIVEAKGETL